MVSLRSVFIINARYFQHTNQRSVNEYNSMPCFFVTSQKIRKIAPGFPLSRESSENAKNNICPNLLRINAFIFYKDGAKRRHNFRHFRHFSAF